MKKRQIKLLGACLTIGLMAVTTPTKAQNNNPTPDEIAGKDIRYIFDSADELIDNYKEAAIRGNNFISVLNIFTKYLNNFSDFDINSILKILEKFKGFDTQNLLNKINSEIK